MSKPKALADLPYRPCVGIALFNRDGAVFVGRRGDDPDQGEGSGGWWQMPQGGIDPGESPADAVARELMEETAVRSASIVAEAPDWIRYDLPPHLIGRAWGGRYRGQTQKWFALRFEGDDSEIDPLHPPGGHDPEFVEWRWEQLDRLPGLIVPFKRGVYDQVVGVFADMPELVRRSWRSTEAR